MKNIVIPIFSLLIASCSIQSQKEAIDKSFGEEIDTSNSIGIEQLESKMKASPNSSITIKGKISEVCQSEGCWLELENTVGQTVIVRMQDHQFTVPKDIAGRTVYVSGMTFLDTTIVEALKHYAEDLGKSQEEINAINKPTIDVVMEAKGIVLLKKDASVE